MADGVAIERAVAVVAILTDERAAELYERLIKWAIRLKCNPDLAQDMAQEAMAAGLENGCCEWHYTSVCLKNAVLQHRRNRRRRNLDYAWTFVEGDPDPVEVRTWGAWGNQESALELSETLAAIGSLPTRTQEVLKLKLREFTDQEIQAVLDYPITEVRWRARVGRDTLRTITGRNPKAKQCSYIGVRKDSRKYTASIRVNGKFVYLGIFGDAKEAAKAYDAAAREAGVPESKLNFPLAA